MTGMIKISFSKNYIIHTHSSNLIWILATLATVIFKVILAFGITSNQYLGMKGNTQIKKDLLMKKENLHSFIISTSSSRI